MKLIEIKDKEKYNDFVFSQKHNQFLQSWEWGDLQKEAGNNIERIGVEEGGSLVLGFTLVEKSLPLGMKYWYAPRINYQSSIINLQLLFDELRKKARNDKVIFLRFDPIEKLSIVNSQLSIVETIDVQPKKTLILDISKSEEDILRGMHQKTRYNIRLSKKKGVEIKIVEAQDLAPFEKDFDEWWNIMEETCKRDGFRLHAKDYYLKQLQIKNEKLKIRLVVARYQGKIIAGNIISFFGDMATYVHGASSNEYRNVMAPYALQWHTIQEAKKYGCKYYDFYGIDEKKWPGFTRFKKGFGGEEVNYPGTFDLIFSKIWYNVYKLIRKLRRMI